MKIEIVLTKEQSSISIEGKGSIADAIAAPAMLLDGLAQSVVKGDKEEYFDVIKDTIDRLQEDGIETTVKSIYMLRDIATKLSEKK